MRIAAFLSCLLALTACGHWNPDFVPSGYEHHGGDAYNAPPGPAAKDIGYTWSAEANMQQQMLWSDVAKDLVEKMESAGVSACPVYMEDLPISNAFNNSLDHALRAELRTRGYTLVPAADQNLHLRYEAYREGAEKIVRRPLYNEDEDIYTKAAYPHKAEAFVFALTALHKGNMLGTAKTRRIMPAYGSVAGEGVRKTPDRLMEGLRNEKR
ncbi:MAG: hypothetical protein ACT4OY_07485 [Alphaproteobacteria bacterium]